MTTPCPTPVSRLPRAGSAAPAMPRRRFMAALLAALGGIAVSEGRADTGADAVTLEAARADQAAGRAILVDVREPDEHTRGVAPGARLLPLSQLGARWSEIPSDASVPVLLICGTQNRSRAALRALRERGGHGHVRYVVGGMTEWARRGWPMVRPGG